MKAFARASSMGASSLCPLFARDLRTTSYSSATFATKGSRCVSLTRGCDAHRPAGVQHMHHRPFIGWRDAECCMHLRRCRSEEHTSELPSLMRISYAVFSLKKNKNKTRCDLTRRR